MKNFGIWYWMTDPSSADPGETVQADELVVTGNVYIFRVRRSTSIVNRPTSNQYDVVYTCPISSVHHIKVV